LKDGPLTNAFVGNEAAYQQYQHRGAANNIETTTMLSAETGRIGAASCGGVGRGPLVLSERFST
jgi:hypothetical protein